MTDNFKLIRNFIQKSLYKIPKLNREPYSYMVVELMRRGKDNPDLPAANYHFKNYYIYSPSDLDKHEEEIKTLCNILNLRAYFSVNVKNMEQVMLDTCAEYARRIAVHDYKKPYSIFKSCSGKYFTPGDKKYVVDIDDISEKPEGYLDKLVEIIDTKCQNQNRLKHHIKFVGNNIKPNLIENQYIKYTGNEEDWVYDNVITVIPTKSGVHIITYGFDRVEFMMQHQELYPEIELPDIKVNHLTLLYENVTNNRTDL